MMSTIHFISEILLLMIFSKVSDSEVLPHIRFNLCTREEVSTRISPCGQLLYNDVPLYNIHLRYSSIKWSNEVRIFLFNINSSSTLESTSLQFFRCLSIYSKGARVDMKDFHLNKSFPTSIPKSHLKDPQISYDRAYLLASLPSLTLHLYLSQPQCCHFILHFFRCLSTYLKVAPLEVKDFPLNKSLPISIPESHLKDPQISNDRVHPLTNLPNQSLILGP